LLIPNYEEFVSINFYFTVIFSHCNLTIKACILDAIK